MPLKKLPSVQYHQYSKNQVNKINLSYIEIYIKNPKSWLCLPDLKSIGRFGSSRINPEAGFLLKFIAFDHFRLGYVI